MPLRRLTKFVYKTPQETSQHCANSTVTTVCMNPAISLEDEPGLVGMGTILNAKKDSSLHDGSNVGVADCYMSVELDGDNSYDTDFMEADGNYNNFLEGIQFNYQVMDGSYELTLPTNIYNWKGNSL